MEAIFQQKTSNFTVFFRVKLLVLYFYISLNEKLVYQLRFSFTTNEKIICPTKK